MASRKPGRSTPSARLDPAPPSKARASTSQPGRAVDPRNLAVRTLSGVVLAGGSLAAICASPAAFGVVALALCLAGIAEYCAMARGMGLSPARGLALGAGAFVLGVPALLPGPMLGLSLGDWHDLALGVAIVGVVIAGVARRNAGPDGAPRCVDVMATLIGVVYFAWMFGFAILMRRLPGRVDLALGVSLDAGALWVMLFLLTSAASDIGCYAFGKMLGSTKLSPGISPNKTVEGSVGGLVVAALCAVLLGCAVQGFHGPDTARGGLPLLLLALYGVVVAATGQLGDLWESWLKREAGLKDSGSLIPGHGGVLDRFDSYFPSAPVAYFLTVWLLQP